MFQAEHLFKNAMYDSLIVSKYTFSWGSFIDRAGKDSFGKSFSARNNENDFAISTRLVAISTRLVGAWLPGTTALCQRLICKHA